MDTHVIVSKEIERYRIQEICQVDEGDINCPQVFLYNLSLQIVLLYSTGIFYSIIYLAYIEYIG